MIIVLISWFRIVTDLIICTFLLCCQYIDCFYHFPDLAMLNKLKEQTIITWVGLLNWIVLLTMVLTMVHTCTCILYIQLANR